MMTVNVVVLAGTVSAEPVQRRMPSGDEVTEFRLSVPEAGRRLLPLPIAAWHATVGARALDEIAKGDRVLVHGQLVRRFYRSGAGARSLTEVVASGIKKLDPSGSPQSLPPELERHVTSPEEPAPDRAAS
ncbi:MAG: single-stranded DNA-binding protein [Actinomycetota bacterium]